MMSSLAPPPALQSVFSDPLRGDLTPFHVWYSGNPVSSHKGAGVSIFLSHEDADHAGDRESFREHAAEMLARVFSAIWGFPCQVANGRELVPTEPVDLVA